MRIDKSKVNFKSKLCGITNVQERNKAFAELTPREQRMEIAWDALQLIMLGKIDPAGLSGSSCYWDESLNKQIQYASDSTDLQDRVIRKTTQESCTVCERGIVMLSTIRLGGNVFSDSPMAIAAGASSTVKGFSTPIMEEMEKEYEHNYFGHPHTDNTLDKMANIMCNVIANGNFNAFDRTNYLEEE